MGQVIKKEGLAQGRISCFEFGPGFDPQQFQHDFKMKARLRDPL